MDAINNRYGPSIKALIFLNIKSIIGYILAAYFPEKKQEEEAKDVCSGRLGIDVGAWWPLWNTVQAQVGSTLGLSPASLVAVLSGALMIVLYLAALAVFVPYVGWVRALWRSAQDGLARKEV